MEGLPQLTKYLCRFSLRTGALVIGTLSMMTGSLSIAGMIYTSNRITTEMEDPDLTTAHWDILMRSRSLAITLATFYAINMMFDLVLVIGTIMTKSRLIYTWIYYNVTCIVVGVIICVCGVVIHVFGDDYWSLGQTIVTCLIDTILTVYFILVVNSYYQVLESKASLTNTVHATA